MSDSFQYNMGKVRLLSWRITRAKGEIDERKAAMR